LISPMFLCKAFMREDPKSTKKDGQVNSIFLHFWDLLV